MIRFTAQAVQLDAQAGDGRRTITGIAVPYGVEATVGNGMRVVFEPGSLPEDGPAPPPTKGCCSRPGCPTPPPDATP